MASHPTHDRLIDAALVLAEDRPLSEIPVDDIVREAGVAKGTFYVHFVDRGSFVAAVTRRFHRQLFGLMADAVTGLEPGPDRLLAGAFAYLDACRDQFGVKSVLIEARAEPAVVIETGRRNATLALAAAPDFAALGVAHPEASARLFVALVAEVTLMEAERGEPDPDARGAAGLRSLRRARTVLKAEISPPGAGSRPSQVRFRRAVTVVSPGRRRPWRRR